jgi:hypothetical protein
MSRSNPPLPTKSSAPVSCIPSPTLSSMIMICSKD